MANNGGLILDARKIISFDNFSRVTGLPCVLAVRFRDNEIYTWKYKPTKFSYIMGGRHDREGGIEAVALIPMDLFTHQSRSVASPGTSRPAICHSDSSRHPTVS